MPVSVMAEALREAGVRTSAEHLDAAYGAAVRQYPDNDVAARNVVVQAVECDLTLLHGLVQAYFAYRRGTRDLDRGRLTKSDRPAPLPPSNGRQASNDSQSAIDPVDAAANGKTGKAGNTGGRRAKRESQYPPDPAGQHHGRGRQEQSASQSSGDPAPVAPATKLTKAGMLNVAKQAAGYGFVLMTVRSADGRPMPMGEIPIDMWKNQIFTAGREKIIGRAVDKYLRRQAHVPPRAKTADIVPETLCKKMQNYAAYASQHGIEHLSDDQLLDDIEAYNG